MIRSTSLLVLCAFALWSSVASAQISAITKVPVGCPIPHTISNDTDGVIFYTPCPPSVFDSSGQPVLILACPQIAVELEAGGTVTFSWSQKDSNGQQVPEGIYFVGGVAYEITSTVDAVLFPLGPQRVGNTRAFQLCAPDEPDGVYVMAASGSTTTGASLPCGAQFPLDLDPLLLQSITNASTFQSFIGQLDGTGATAAPRIAVPNDPSLAGVSFSVAFLVVDPLDACPVAAVSAPRTVTIVP